MEHVQNVHERHSRDLRGPLVLGSSINVVPPMRTLTPDIILPFRG